MVHAGHSNHTCIHLHYLLCINVTNVMRLCSFFPFTDNHVKDELIVAYFWPIILQYYYNNYYMHSILMVLGILSPTVNVAWVASFEHAQFHYKTESALLFESPGPEFST